MIFNKYFGFIFTLLGSIFLLFLGTIFLVPLLPTMFDVEIDMPTELLELASRFTFNDPTVDLLAPPNVAALLPYNLFGQSLFADTELFFSFAIALVAIGLGLTLSSFTSLFSPLSSGMSFTVAFLLAAAILVGSIFQTPNTISLDNISTDSLIGAATLASPLFGILFGSIFQFIYFGQRKNRAKAL